MADVFLSAILWGIRFLFEAVAVRRPFSDACFRPYLRLRLLPKPCPLIPAFDKRINQARIRYEI